MTLKQLGLLTSIWAHSRNVNSLQTNADSEAVRAFLQADVNSLQTDADAEAVGARLQVDVNSLQTNADSEAVGVFLLCRQMQKLKQLGLVFKQM
jgi:hypothetical protein